MHSLFSILQKAQAKYPQFGKRMNEAMILSRWKETVGDLIAKHAQALAIQGSILLVDVDHPAWLAELLIRKRQLLDKLNEGSKHPLVTDIRYMEKRRR